MKRALRTIETIIIHCADTPPEWMAGRSVEEKIAEIDRWHRARGWAGIGYHYVIDRDGSIGKGRPLSRVGAHTRGHNRDSVGICLIGGRGGSRRDAFSQHFTPEQNTALRRLIKEIENRVGQPLDVFGHYHFDPHRECPCFDVERWLSGDEPRKSPLESTTIQATGAGAVATIGGVIQSIGVLDRQAQIIAIALGAIVLASLAWIARERLRKWASGDR